MSSILITGATGNIGKVLAEHLKEKHQLTLVDIDFSNVSPDLLKGTTVKELDLTEAENWEGLLEDIEYVIHLAGDPRPDAEFYGSLMDLNYKIPHNLFKEATKYENFVKRIIFASSIHAVGAYPPNVQVKTSDYPRPADLYGVSKVYAEALASYYAYTAGQESIGIRIGNFDGDIEGDHVTVDTLAFFLSPRDCCHLFDCALEAKLKTPFLLVNGVSNNRFPRLDIDQAKVDIGYKPQDDAFALRGTINFEKEESIDLDEETFGM